MAPRQLEHTFILISFACARATCSHEFLCRHKLAVSRYQLCVKIAVLSDIAFVELVNTSKVVVTMDYLADGICDCDAPFYWI